MGALLITLGLELAREATGIEGQVIGLAFVIAGAAIVFMKYKFNLPDISPADMQAQVEQFAAIYEGFITTLSKAYEGALKARDEILMHRQMIEALAKALPQKYQDYLKNALDALEKKYAVT
jgi:hypothetical protein